MVDQISSYFTIGSKTRCRAAMDFRGEQRFDCLRLKEDLMVDDKKFKCVRLMWIVSGLATGVMCIGVPLFSTDELRATNSGQMLALQYFTAVKRIPGKLVLFRPELTDRIEQVQFLASRRG